MLTFHSTSVVRYAASLLPVVVLLAGSPAFAKANEQLSADLTQPEERTQAQLDVLEGMLKAGMVDDALKVATQLRADGMKDSRLDVLQARAMHARGMSSQAADLLRTLTKREPRNADAWSELGIVLSDAKDTEGASLALERAHRLLPTDAQVMNNLGYVQMARGLNQRAADLFEAALVQNPSSARIRNNLGFALARMEHDTDALESFRAAGSEADARYNMGVACELRGDTASALTNYQAAVQAAPANPHAAAALSRLLQPESP